ncbi:hypothetical protein D3C77_367630 [compost metagenome]
MRPVFIDLIHHEVQRLTPVRQPFGKCQVALGQNMVIIHHIEHHICEMQRRIGSQRMTGIIGINARGVQQHTMLAQYRNIVP